MTSMEILQELQNITEFLSGTDDTQISPLQTHLLRRWKPNTLHSYNSAVKKFLKFYQDTYNKPFKLPVKPSDIYKFCLSAGRSDGNCSEDCITAKTLSKYLSAIQAWHLFHQVTYPRHTRDVVKVMLRASERSDALEPPKIKRPAVMLDHLLALYHSLRNGSVEDSAILDCVICAFWGLARLAEVTYDSRDTQPQWINSLLVEDVLSPRNALSHVVLRVRGAKTARPGISQQILLNAQPNCLCPVEAVLRRAATTGNPTDSLFGYQKQDGSRGNLTRSMVVNKCQQVWNTHGWNALSGHSFRVGGASWRAALGIPHEDIKKLGRWSSSCYLIYLREYSEGDRQKTLRLIEMLNNGYRCETV